MVNLFNFLIQDGNASSSDDEEDNTAPKKFQITIRSKSEMESTPPVNHEDVLLTSIKGLSLQTFDDKKR
jgi:hypothetical protein